MYTCVHTYIHNNTLMQKNTVEYGCFDHRVFSGFHIARKPDNIGKEI